MTYCSAIAQNKSTVILPNYDDAYSKLVRQLEKGQTDIDYRQFRHSFLESEQFKVASTQNQELNKLRGIMHELMKQSKYVEIIDVTKTILSFDYTDMEAHKILQQTYKILGDATNQKKYYDIEFGLLKSIVKSGDGKTCQTAWPVIQPREEYFILSMIGATKFLRQSIDKNGGLCDKIEVQTNEGPKVYYFEISKIFQAHNKRGIH
jgi:hypothetical protein